MILHILCASIGVLCLLAPDSPARAVRFEDATEAAGIDFIHVNGAHGAKYVIETVGPGAAFFDYDNDGDLDLYLVNGAATPGGDPSPATNALYRNEGDGTFKDVTGPSGTGDTGYGMGVAAGDIDNDGDADLYVANYHDFSYANHKVCAEGGSGLQLYCGPEAFNGVRDVLYRNEGDGTFKDITQEAGLFSDQGKELGVVFGDVDWDGDADLYLANDKTLNFLYINDGTGVFSETGLLAGAAYNEDGDVEAGMGVDMGDYDGDGWPDLFVTNFQWETNTLYRNLGDATFLDETFPAGLGKGSIPYLSWGTRLIDLDNDGDRDVFIASGHLESDVEQYENTTFAQRNQVFVNDGTGHFSEETDIEGTALAIRKVSRGAAFGDYDGDGAVDILVSNVADRPTLMRNTTAAGNWLAVQLVGTKSNRSAYGTRVEVFCGGRRQIDEVRGGGSYLSQSDLRLHFGLGAASKVDRVRILWPSGEVEEYADLPPNRVLRAVEGGR